MCKVMEDMRNETARMTKFEMILNLMESLKITAEAAMDALKITKEEQAIYKGMLPRA